MTQRTDGTMTQEEQDAEYKIIECAANVLDENLTEGRVYVVLVFDGDEPEGRQFHNACLTNAEPVKAGVALYMSAVRFRDKALAEGMDEVHTDDN